MGFEKIAKYYSLLFDEETRLKYEGNFLIDIIKSLPFQPQVLDLACGTGVHSRFLGRLGTKIVGVDLSPTMLEIAKDKTSSENVKYLVADILNLPLINQWDLILCVGNTLCLLIGEEKVKKLFLSLYELVKPEGLFLIQIVNYENPENQNVSTKVVKKEKLGFKTTITKTLVPDKDLVYLSIAYFVENAKTLESMSESNFLKKWSIEDITRLSKDVGFKIKAVYGDYQKNPFEKEKSKDLIILLQK
ncbi:MAG: methyltransferase domain-containing protein [Candidatus Hydrogenedentes bacterium]|nr:methyltransferase domain-containing protein [Candidatus Hydrogenedentota bacterium]